MSAARIVTLLFAGLWTAAAGASDEALARLVAELGLQESARPVREHPGWRKPERVVVARADAERIAWLREVAPDVEFIVVQSADEAAREAAQADAVLGVCTPGVVNAGSRLRWIQVFSAGVERCVSIPGIGGRGLVLTNMQKVAGPVMAEHVMAFTLALARGFGRYVPLQAGGRWSPEAVDDGDMWELRGRTMLVVGLGGIGTEVAKRAHALGMTVLAIRNSSREGPPWVREVGLSQELNAYAARADVVVNTLPLTDQTRGIFDRAFFDAVKRGALFVNVGRGASVVTADLLAALADGRIGGAGLDVTDPEPLPADHPLWRAPNVLITPHVSATVETGGEPRWLIVRENLRRYAAGEKLLSEVDLARGY